MPQIHKNFEVHDHLHFEMKLDYWLDSHDRNDYQVDSYLFLPNSLDLNPHTYPRQAFYEDIKNYVRLKTPELTLAKVPSLAEGAPGRLLSDGLDRFKNAPQDRDARQDLEYHLKMYVSIAVRALKNGRAGCFADLQQRQTGPVIEFLGETDGVLGLIRKLMREIPSGAPGTQAHRVKTVMTSADEYLSSEVHQTLLRLLSLVQEQGGVDKELIGQLLATVRELAGYRLQQGYPTLEADPAQQDETVLFRRGIFKKFFRSPLFLSQHRQREGRLAGQVAMGLAAGLSMIFATLIAFLAQRHFGSYTMPLFVALVVGYIFKDRIKELTKVYLEKWLRTRVADTKTHFFDQEGHCLGVCRESVRYTDPGQLPPAILTLRDRNHLTEIANFWHAEKIIHYRKEVSLFGKDLQRANPGYDTAAVNDIIRYNVHRLLRNMDEPEKELLALGDEGVVRSIVGGRIYKVNLVVQLSKGPQQQFLRFRLILDRDGIRRMEMVAPPEKDQGAGSG